MKAIAIDDEPVALEVIQALAAKVPYLEVTACFTNVFKAQGYLQSEHVDLLFLDINMPYMSGFEFMASLQHKPLVVFTTAFAEHAVHSFEVDAIDYLLKPFSAARFLKACNKALDILRLRGQSFVQKDYVFLKTGYDQVKVLFKDILYVAADGNYITLVLEDKKVLSRMSLSELSELLPVEKFARVHRSYIVAKDRIERIERHQVCIQGTNIPAGASYLKQLQL